MKLYLLKTGADLNEWEWFASRAEAVAAFNASTGPAVLLCSSGMAIWSEIIMERE